MVRFIAAGAPRPRVFPPRAPLTFPFPCPPQRAQPCPGGGGGGAANVVELKTVMKVVAEGTRNADDVEQESV